MDETTKVIIATISGFVISFLAEPVKNYFANRAKLHNLRIALYKEMLSNYIFMKAYGENTSSFRPENVVQIVIRRECYTQSLENEVYLFYQLNEAHQINVLQGSVLAKIFERSTETTRLLDKSRTMKLAEKSPDFDSKVLDHFREMCNSYARIFAICCYQRSFNREIIEKLTNQPQYEEIMKRGKESSEQGIKTEGQ